MSKKLDIVFIIAIIVNIIISAAAVILYFIPFKDALSSTEIYNQCLKNVVEVKSSSKNYGEGFGTGEIVTSDGKIVTNAHVVTFTRLGTTNEFDEYYIRFAFENEYRSVRLEKYDLELDLAVLILEDCSDIVLNPINLSDSDTIKAGDIVYAVGNASNYGMGIFKGIVSIPLINVELDGLTRSVIQCDLTIAAGNSGGALLNENGELIGITTFRTKDISGNVIYGIAYCIPINALLEYIDINN
ncbi:MAG: serine protease [Ruminococcus flavefaciens]|nr:serine protease [Ruminococcus flavefaciens]